MRSQRFAATPIACISLGLMLLLTGCADSADENVSPFEGTNLLDGAQPGGSPGSPAKPGGSDDETGLETGGGDDWEGESGGIEGHELVFLHDVSKPLEMIIGESLPLLVKALDYSTGGPADGLILSWAILDAEGPGAPGDASLAFETTHTSLEGFSQILFDAGSDGQVLYTIEVTADLAEPRTVQIAVGDPPTGDLHIELTYEGPIELNTVRVQVVPSGFNCSQFNPTNPPIEILAEKTVLSPNSSPTFHDLVALQKVTVVATAKGPNGNLAGSACADAIHIEGNSTTEVTLPLYMLLLNPAGTYDLENNFDLTGTIPGELGLVLDTLTGLFYDPGAFLVSQIKALVEEFVGGILTNFIFQLFEDQLGDLITDWVLNDSPAWIQDFFTIGQDVFQVIADLKLTGDLKISKLMSDLYVQGEIEFTGIILSWKLNCDKNSPDYDECGLYPFSLEDFNDEDFPLELLSGTWNGMVTDQSTLLIDPHTLALNYGKLVLFVFNNLILQELTGEDNLVDAAASMVGCDNIADSLSSIGLDEEDIYDACYGAVGLLVVPLSGILASLETDSLIKLQGTAVLRDDDDDLIVDRITPGEWAGVVLIEGAAGSPFDGTWEAHRQTP
jgi:hypothetical protein